MGARAHCAQASALRSQAARRLMAPDSTGSRGPLRGDSTGFYLDTFALRCLREPTTALRAHERETTMILRHSLLLLATGLAAATSAGAQCTTPTDASALQKSIKQLTTCNYEKLRSGPAV